MRKKLALLSGITLLFTTLAQTQENALFHTTIWFEDAVGNRDSIVVGYDPDATTGIDTEFGEVEITVPFDSIFEVRAMCHFDFEQSMSKVIINRSQFIPAYNCHSWARIGIFAWSKYPPVTISWDSAAFLEDRCLRGSFLSNHILDELAGPINPQLLPPICACMAAKDSQIFDMTYEGLIEQYQMTDVLNISHALSVEALVEGMGEQVIYGLRFKPEDVDGYTPCYWITVSTDDPDQLAPLTIFPNPSSGVIKTSGAVFETVSVWDATGRHIGDFYAAQDREINLSGLLAGMYWLLARDRDGKRYVGKVVKL